MSGDLERKRFFQSALKDAEADFRKNDKDSVALTRWGGALLELANFQPGEEAAAMVDDAVTKFQMALTIEPKKHDTLWCLGNAYTSQGFLSANRSSALTLFRKGKECFMEALVQQPDNEMYKKGVDMTDRAPDLYEEIQKQILQQSPGMAGPPQESQSTFWFDALGWVTFVGFVMSVSMIISMSTPAQPGLGSPAPETAPK